MFKIIHKENCRSANVNTGGQLYPDVDGQSNRPFARWSIAYQDCLVVRATPQISEGLFNVFRSLLPPILFQGHVSIQHNTDQLTTTPSNSAFAEFRSRQRLVLRADGILDPTLRSRSHGPVHCLWQGT